MEKSRLPKSAIPVNYSLSFDIDLKKFVFGGNEEIELNIPKPTKEIVLNSSGLKIGTAQIIFKKKKLDAKIRLDEKEERLSLKFDEKVKGNARLSVSFEGKFADSLLGFYRSKYIDRNGKAKYVVTTQFEAPYARRAFPCFDEPEYKATFDVSMKVDKKLFAVSNMPVKKESSSGGKKNVHFFKTPRMSTYLLYLGAGDFEFIQSRLGKTLVRVITIKGKKKQGQFALDVAKRILGYFEKYSGIRYPLPKLDLLAIPDFASGAMENWGAITFREVGLLSDPKLTSAATKIYITMVIAHEIWHQWSGDLVTMHWWNDLWLNESFATFMSYMAIDHLFPEWNAWEDFIIEETIHALDEDSLKTTHPISVVVDNPRQVEEIFDAISYNKGGSVLRMLENYLGKENFRRGISQYLSKFKYQNATSEDLWNVLAKVSGKHVKDIMLSWLKQPGYPIVESFKKDKEISLSQEKFSFHQNDGKTVWPIPLSIKFADGSELTKLFSKKRDHITLKQDQRWFKINVGQTGFYRTRYSEENLFQLKHLIYNKLLQPLDRWGIESDLFELSMFDGVGIDEYMKFIKAYKTEDNYLTLTDIVINLRQIYFVFFDELQKNSAWPKFREHFREPFLKILQNFGWEPKENEDHRVSLLRELALTFLVFVEDPEVVTIALDKFDEYVKNKIMLNPNVSGPIFYAAASTGGKKEYENLLKIYNHTRSLEEKLHVLGALGKFKDKKLLLRTLNFSLSDKVRLQDIGYPIGSVASNPCAREIFLDWMKKNWKKIESYKKIASPIFMHIVEYMVTAYTGKAREKELKKFFASHPIEYKMVLNKSFEKMEKNTYWLERNRDSLGKYLAK